MPNTELADELLQLEEADAWFEYLESTRGQTKTRYAELEPWAAPPFRPGAARAASPFGGLNAGDVGRPPGGWLDGCYRSDRSC